MLLSVSFFLAQVYLGAQALLLTGTHTDVAGTQRGAAAGALLQFGVRSHRVDLHVEGIPPVSLPQAPSDAYGQATPQLSVLNGALRYAIDPQQRLWLGAGATVINQRTPLPKVSQVVGSRLAGYRIEALYHVPLNEAHFIEVVAGGAPHLTGSDHYDYSIPHPSVNKPEVAAELDAMIAFGIVQRNAEWLFGIRNINFAAKFIDTGEAADRNNGAGLLAEYRAFIH
jgi:hypothetical protein